MSENQTFLQSLFNRNFEFQPTIETLRRIHLDCSFTTSEPNGEGNIIGIICRNQDGLHNITLPQELANLEYLNLSDNPNLTSLFFQGSFPKLKHFDCSDSRINYLDFPSGFKALAYCDASRNEIEEFNFNGDMPALTFLEISKNKITELYFRHKYDELKYLYCIDNHLGALRFKYPMPELDVLDLRKNNLHDLPENLYLFDSLSELYLDQNPLTKISQNIVGQGEHHNSAEEVIAYLEGIKKSDIKYLREAKMVLVGNGEVGKSSIRIKLIDENAPLPKKVERTPGLDISTYTINEIMPMSMEEEVPESFDLNIWDFGGQGKYREIQQLFCSPKTLYLFVTACDDEPTKEDYVGFEYWMSMVNAYSYEEDGEQPSPVIHVVNKIDIKEKLINQKDLIEIFPNIGGFVKVSCEKLTNFQTLRDTIRDILPDVNRQIFNEPFTENWLNVKALLQSRQNENHIEYNEFLDICNQNDLSNKEAQAWIKVLDRIGSVIYFGKDPDLKDWVILNPIWVKEALYLALDAPIINNATITANLFPYIWQNKSAEEHQKLIALMCACKLCYKKENSKGELEYIVPSLLKSEPPNLPDHLTTPNYEVKFTFDPFIPAGTVNKLMVNLHKRIFNDLKWKNNVIFFEPQSNAYAHISENWEEKCVDVQLFGNDVMSIYNLVHSNLKEINTNLKNSRFIQKLDFEVTAMYKEDWFDLKTLKAFGANELSFLWNKQGHPTNNDNSDNMEKIKDLIGNARLEKAIDLLLQQVPEEFKNEVRGHKSRLAELKKNERIGIISFSDASLEKNKITHSVLSLISDVEKGRVKEDDSKVSPPPPPPSTNSKIFFSYAWGVNKETGENREEIVDKLYDSLETDRKYTLVRDKKDAGYKKSIVKFMEEIGRGENIIVVISDKYLKSPNCMFELLEIYKRSGSDEEEFVKRIFPIILGDANFYNPKEILKYIKHWKNEVEELDAAILDVGLQDARAVLDDFDNLVEIKNNVGKLANILKSINTLNPQMLSEDNFSEIKKAIAETNQG